MYFNIIVIELDTVRILQCDTFTLHSLFTKSANSVYRTIFDQILSEEEFISCWLPKMYIWDIIQRNYNKLFCTNLLACKISFDLFIHTELFRGYIVEQTEHFL